MRISIHWSPDSPGRSPSNLRIGISSAVRRWSARRESGRELVGLLLEDRGVLRSHQKVLVGGGTVAGLSGEVTSGTFSPTLNRSIALARVPKTSQPTVQVDIRGKLHAARIVKPPFVRHGKSLIDIS